MVQCHSVDSLVSLGVRELFNNVLERTPLTLEGQAGITLINDGYIKFIDESTPESESMHIVILCVGLLKPGINFASEL